MTLQLRARAPRLVHSLSISPSLALATTRASRTGHPLCRRHTSHAHPHVHTQRHEPLPTPPHRPFAIRGPAPRRVPPPPAPRAASHASHHTPQGHTFSPPTPLPATPPRPSPSPSPPSPPRFSPDFVPSSPAPPETDPPAWAAISANKRAVRAARIPPDWKLHNPLLPLNVTTVPETCGILTPAEVEITRTPAARLVQLMVGKTYTAEAVTAAFCKRAALAQQLTNCLTEILFARALSDARALDAEYAATGVPRGKLHGLPVSLKDNFNLPGLDSSNGYVAYCNVPMGEEDTADIAKVLQAAGAILYCKTNVPTAMLMGETYNNVWGYTPNPHNTDYTCGGSSGGEAVLLAMGGSPLGVGTDIGGSIRMPAAMCGVYGLKPSAGRFPVLGIRPVLPGQESVRPTVGPLAPDLDALELWSQVVLESKPWERDPGVFNMPWREITVPDKLCFGMITDDGIVRPTPAVARVLRETRAALEAAGHEVIEWAPPDTRGGIALLKRFLLADGGRRIGRALKAGAAPEPWPLQLRTVEKHYRAHDTPTAAQLWALQAQRQAYLRTLLDAWTATRGITSTGRAFDAVISPVTAFPSTPRYTFRHAGYAGLWNLADMTSLAFPAGRADRADVQVGEVAWRNDDERNIWAKYDAERLHGIPIGLQLVTPRHTEELAIKLTRVVVEAIREQEEGQIGA